MLLNPLVDGVYLNVTHTHTHTNTHTYTHTHTHTHTHTLKGTVMQIEIALINGRLRVSKVS